MGGGIDRSFGSQSCPFVGCHLDPNLVGNRVRDLALEAKDVGKAALVTLRSTSLRSLATSTNCTVMRTRSPTRSAEPRLRRPHASSRASSDNGGWVPLNRIAGASARDDPQRCNLREVGDEGIGHPVGKNSWAGSPERFSEW